MRCVSSSFSKMCSSLLRCTIVEALYNVFSFLECTIWFFEIAWYWRKGKETTFIFWTSRVEDQEQDSAGWASHCPKTSRLFYKIDIRSNQIFGIKVQFWWRDMFRPPNTYIIVLFFSVGESILFVVYWVARLEVLHNKAPLEFPWFEALLIVNVVSFEHHGREEWAPIHVGVKETPTLLLFYLWCHLKWIKSSRFAGLTHLLYLIKHL